MKNNFIAILGVLLSSQTSLAYEISTHIKLSDEAVNTSTLSKDPTTLTSLGLKSVDDTKDVFPNSKNLTKPRTIRELIQDGANFEDDTSPIKRPLNHFFDPVHNRPLTVLGIPLGLRSPDWALEDEIEIEDQEFSYREGREYFYKALTPANKEERDKYLGRMFQTLGQVIHHIQDMAQPQHVRNDQHLDHPEEFFGVIPNPFYNPSRYEKYTDVLGNLPFGQYEDGAEVKPVYLSPPRKFWIDDTQKKGLAEFTNNNFVSAGTNFRFDGSGATTNPDYDLPVSTGQQTSIPIGQLFAEKGEPVPCKNGAAVCEETEKLSGDVIFYSTLVSDKYRDTQKINERASTLSIFDQDLKQYNAFSQTGETLQAFSLNRFNFDAAHQFLIPRAVAYSAGLIDYCPGQMTRRKA